MAVLAAAPAHASSTQAQTFEAPRDLLNPATRDAALAKIDSLGTHALRVVLYWRSVAPSATLVSLRAPVVPVKSTTAPSASLATVMTRDVASCLTRPISPVLS